MSIKPMYGAESKYIGPGQHKVVVIEVKSGMTKGNPVKNTQPQPMVTVTMQNSKGQTINGYFTQAPFSQKKLQDLKAATGNPNIATGSLVGARLGILVDKQKNNPKFEEIVAYAPEAEADESRNSEPLLEQAPDNSPSALPF